MILVGKPGAGHGLQSGCFLNLATSHYWQMMLLLCEAWQWYPLVEEDSIADPDPQFFEADRLISCNFSWNAFLCGIRTFHHTQSRREAAEGGREELCAPARRWAESKSQQQGSENLKNS